jgi:hypothetical protein
LRFKSWYFFRGCFNWFYFMERRVELVGEGHRFFDLVQIG